MSLSERGGASATARRGPLRLRLPYAMPVSWQAIEGPWKRWIATGLEVRATQKARTAISEVIDMVPDEAELAGGGGRVAVEEVEVGAVVVVKPGAKVPIDGDVIKGESTVNEAAITGEARPVKKSVGAAVLAGTVNQAGYLEVLVWFLLFP